MYTLEGAPRRMTVKVNADKSLTQTILVSMKDSNGFRKSEVSNFDFSAKDTYEKQDEKAMLAAESIVARYNKK